MSYRSIKRVLGETSLERKCRLLFGACLLLLIGGAFWGIDRIASRLVMTTTRNHGHDLVDIIMIKVHSLRFKTETRGSGEESSRTPEDEMRREWLQEIIVDFEESQDYQYEIVSLVRNYDLNYVTPVEPRDQREREVLVELEKKLQQQHEQLAEEKQPANTELTPEQALGERKSVWYVPCMKSGARKREGKNTTILNR